jgi:hypothetical protein
MLRLIKSLDNKVTEVSKIIKLNPLLIFVTRINNFANREDVFNLKWFETC